MTLSAYVQTASPGPCGYHAQLIAPYYKQQCVSESAAASKLLGSELLKVRFINYFPPTPPPPATPSIEAYELGGLGWG